MLIYSFTIAWLKSSFHLCISFNNLQFSKTFNYTNNKIKSQGLSQEADFFDLRSDFWKIFQHKDCKFSTCIYIPDSVYFLKFRSRTKLLYNLRNIIITFLSFYFLACDVSWCNPSSETIHLAYENIDTPPNCIIPHKLIKRPKVGIALSGGGIRGIAQIGVLEVLEQNHIQIDMIVGSSIGAIIGGLYAIGYKPSEIFKIAKTIDWDNILRDNPPRATQFLGEKQERDRHIIQFRFSKKGIELPQALTPGHQLTRILSDLTMKAPYRSTDFDKLNIPLRIITSDLLTGKKVLIKSGELSEAMRASISIPLLFTPIQKDSMLLVDGGILDNIPVLETFHCGADIVITVDTTSPLRPRSQMDAPWKIADQVTTIMQQDHNRSQRENASIIIDLGDCNYSSTETMNIEELYSLGKKLTEQKIDKIKEVINSNNVVNDKLLSNIHILEKGETNDFADSVINTINSTSITKNEIIKYADHIYNEGSFKDITIDINDSLDNTYITFNFLQNPRLLDMTFDGNTVYSDSVLKLRCSEILGKSLNYNKCKSCLHKIEEYYRVHGYSLMQITDINYNEQQKTVLLKIDEGFVGKVKFEGLKRTKQYVVRREFSLSTNDIFNHQILQKGIDNIYGTGLVNSILWSTDRMNDKWDISVRLQEKVFSLVRLGARYDLERRGRIFLELSDENIFGTGSVALMHAQYGGKDIKFEGFIRSDRIFRTYLTSKIRLYHFRSKHYAFSDGDISGRYMRNSTGLTLSIGQQIERFGTVSLISRTERINLQSISGYGYSAGTLNLQTLGLNSVIDTRDHMPFPTSGKFHQFSYEVSSGDFLNSSISYFKFFNKLESFYTYFQNHTIHPTFSWGTSDQTTPYSEQFRIGGLQSFYGLREEELVGRHFIVGELEYRINLKGIIPLESYFSIISNTGAVWRNNVDVKFKDFIYSIGSRFSINSIIGPISVAYGYTNKKRYTIYFSAGYDF